MHTPQRPEEQLMRARQLQDAGQVQEAEAAYMQLIRLYPDFTPVLGNFASLLMTTGRVKESVPILARAVQLTPDEGELQSMLLSAYTQLGKLDEALTLGRKMALQFPDQPDVHYNLSNLYLYFGKVDEAMEACKRTLVLNPNLAHAHYNMGNMLYGRQEMEAALESFQQAIKCDPTLSPAYGNGGYVLYGLSRFDEALTMLLEGSKRDPNDPLIQKNLGLVYHSLEKLDLAEQHYRKSLELRPNLVDSLISMGNLQRELGQEETARNFYKDALEVEPDNAYAKEQLAQLEAGQIQSWHLEMLADKARNQAYDAALKSAMDEGKTVLDIGTGSGLLALMAARAGAKQVYGCELVPSLADAARQVVAANGYTGKINVINKKSTALSIGEEVPEKVDVIVSEILDCGLLAEGVLPSHRHAVANLLKPGGLVIPAAATIEAVLLESDYLRAIHPLNEVEGFDLSPLASFDPANTYKMTHLKRVPYRTLSEPFKAARIDLANPGLAINRDNPKVTSYQVPVTTSGNLQAIAFWFELHLDDTITESSGPDGNMHHWGQAIFYLPEDQQVEAGTTLNIEMLQTDLLISFRVS